MEDFRDKYFRELCQTEATLKASDDLARLDSECKRLKAENDRLETELQEYSKQLLLHSDDHRRLSAELDVAKAIANLSADINRNLSIRNNELVNANKYLRKELESAEELNDFYANTQEKLNTGLASMPTLSNYVEALSTNDTSEDRYLTFGQMWEVFAILEPKASEAEVYKYLVMETVEQLAEVFGMACDEDGTVYYPVSFAFWMSNIFQLKVASIFY